MTKRKFIKRSASIMSLGIFGLAAFEAYRVNVAAGIADQAFKDIINGAAISVSDLTDVQRRILLRVEDPGFETHKGIDLSTPGAGLTTMTQALTKRVFFEDFKPGFAKIEQSLIARYVVHPRLSKDEQITAFLNVAYFGNCQGKQIKGFPDAADCYLGKSFDELSDQDFINLTARLIGPNKYNRDAEALADRIGKINRLLRGECEPNGNRDVTYNACK